MAFRSTRWLSLLAIGLTALALGACGDDEDESSSTPSTQESTQAEQPAAGSGGETLQIDAVEGGTEPFGFSKERLTAPAGEVTITMANPSANQAPHAVEVEGNGIEEVGETVTAGGTSTVTADLKPGRYTFYCPVGDHREEGMEGTLTVE
jgi:plastocyanin